jgi:hypothetical protein
LKQQTEEASPSEMGVRPTDDMMPVVSPLPSREGAMQQPPLDLDCADLAPSDPVLTSYDEEYLVTYLRLLDADTEGGDWREVSRIAPHIDAEREPDRAWRAFDSHLARARWMTEAGYRHLLSGGASLGWTRSVDSFKSQHQRQHRHTDDVRRPRWLSVIQKSADC